MSKKTLSLLVSVCAFCTVSTLTTGCDFTEAQGSFDDLDVIIEMEPVNTFAVGQVIDASTGELIGGDVQITFGGPDQGTLVDAYSDPLTEATAEQGFFSFGVQNAVTPSEGDPVQVVVNATAPGYYPASQNVEIREAGPSHAVALYLLPADPDQLSDDASRNAEVVGETGEDGTLEQAVSVSTSSVEGQTTLTLPAGIQFVDESGNPVDGTATARLTQYDLSSPELLLALQATSDASAAGKNSRVAFEETAMEKYEALVNAGIFIGGKDGQDYDTDISRSQAARILAQLQNQDIQMNVPDTDFSDASGDYYYAAYLDLKKRLLDTQDLTFKLNEQKEAELEAKRLGLIAILKQMQTIKDGLMLDIKGTKGPVNILVKGDGWAKQFVAAAKEAGLFTLHDMPIGEKGDLILRSGGLEKTIEISDFSTGTQTVDFSDGPQAEDVTFDIQLDCTVKLKPPFNATLSFRELGAAGPYQTTGQPVWETDELGRVSGGSLTIPNLVTGETYHFVLYVPEANETRTQDITITGADMVYQADVPGDLCVR
ncbi:MAG TPA: hypothetical protein VFG50_00070 [Rhodothermales bacterium]|nr:hypothetical protein [Rhodothermales bacterium]